MVSHARGEGIFAIPDSSVGTFKSPLLSRRALVGGLVSALSMRPSKASARGDIEPMRSQLYRMLEVLPDRSGSPTGDFPPIIFIDGTGPGWQLHDALESALFQPGSPQRIDPEDWRAFLGFPAGDIEASIYQQSSEGTLRILKGAFSFDRIEEIRNVVTTTGYERVGPSGGYPEMRRTATSGDLQARFPSIDGIQDGRYDTIAFLDNQMLVIASDPELVQLVRDAERKRIPYMTFGPGIGGVLHHEPEAVYEAVIVPASAIPDDTKGPHLLSATVLTSFPEIGSAATWAMTAARPTWTAIATLSWKERGRLVAPDEVDDYVDSVQQQFGASVSIQTGLPFTEYMTIAEYVQAGSTVTLTLVPATSVDTYYGITDMALENDLGFLSPG